MQLQLRKTVETVSGIIFALNPALKTTPGCLLSDEHVASAVEGFGGSRPLGEGDAGLTEAAWRRRSAPNGASFAAVALNDETPARKRLGRDFMRGRLHTGPPCHLESRIYSGERPIDPMRT